MTVKRYVSRGLIAADKGEVVFYEDYQSLRAALREALAGWERQWGKNMDHAGEAEIYRIQALKDQFGEPS